MGTASRRTALFRDITDFLLEAENCDKGQPFSGLPNP
jgi:hypothetical protein